MKQKKNPPLPKTVRLRIDDEAFDAVRLKNGDYKVAEVVLSHFCTHGDVVRADETGRVVTVVKNRFETKVDVCGSAEEAEELGQRYASEGVPFRVEMSDVVLSARRVDLDDYIPCIDPEHEKEEYDYAWGRILKEFGDFDCEHEGESWQHMGSWDGEHDFRHRNLPGSDSYTYRSYPWSKGWRPRRGVPRGRMRCHKLDRCGACFIPEDGTVKLFTGMSDLDSVRMLRFVRERYGAEKARDRDVHRGGHWLESYVEEMLAATLTEESALQVEYLDRFPLRAYI